MSIHALARCARWPRGGNVLLLLLQGFLDGTTCSAATLEWSHPSGLYEQPFELSIRCTEPGMELRVTTNGSSPVLSSEKLGAPRTVAATTVIRVGAYRNGKVSGPAETRTFIFPAQVAEQTGAAFPAVWGTNQGRAVPASYAMTRQIVDRPEYRREIVPALRALPALSIVMEPEELFGAEKGIYIHPQETGPDSERVAALELILPGRAQAVRAECGIRVQGGWNRRPEESPKHSFRLLFRKKYGSASFRFPLFERPGAAEVENLILRGGNNNSWLHWSGEERKRADLIRDQWMRETLAEMGRASARGAFVHLYLNGLYWGLYNVCERPDAHFAAAQFGGKARDYDSRNADKILEGDGAAWKRLFELANGGLGTTERFNLISELIDLPEFCDYMLVNLYGANADWDRSSNWYAARKRTPAGRFHFFIWDGERTLEKVQDNRIDFADDVSPPGLFQKLRANRDFRVAFAERAKIHLSAEGALSPAKAAKRFQFWASRLDQAMVAESARWGAYRREVHPYKTGPYEVYTRNEHWRPEVERLLSSYFPQRTEVFREQLRAAGLFE